VLFGTYTLLGAVSEHILYYLSGVKKTLSNPVITGFPIYGIGGLTIYWIRNIILRYIPTLPIYIEFLVYGVVLSSIEYISGKIVGAGSSSYVKGTSIVDSWDYSKNPINIQGVVDIQHFLLFSMAGLLMSRLNPYILSTLVCDSSI